MTRPPQTFPPPGAVGLAAQDPRYDVRQVVLQVYVNNIPVGRLLWARVRYSFAEPVATAQFMVAQRLDYQPGFSSGPGGESLYDSEVVIAAGTHRQAGGGVGLVVRFVGRLRNPSAELWPQAVTYNCVGQLQFAAEYINGKVTNPNDLNSSSLALRLYTGGLVIPDILGRPPPWGSGAFLVTARDLIARVLFLAGVPFDDADIKGTNILYGMFPFTYVWSSGTPSADNVLSQVAIADIWGPRQAGETALEYIQRYDQIDAEWDGHTSGGFYRTSEGVGGRVYRWRIGGRPSGTAQFVFTDNDNILDGSIERKYPLGNSMIVTGGDLGGASGPMLFAAIDSNPFQNKGPRFAPNAPSSPMIDWATISMNQTGPIPYGLPGSITGQNCETVARAALLEANKITPLGHITTAEDYPFTQGQTVVVQSQRLLSTEPFWVLGVTFDCGYGTEGEPILTQTLEIQGGGVDSSNSPPPA